MKNKKINITINGQKHESTVSTKLLLLDFIRENINMTGTKWGCLTGDCGACTILLNGIPVNSCIILAVDADDSEILTVYSLFNGIVLDQLPNQIDAHGQRRDHVGADRGTISASGSNPTSITVP